MEGNILKFKKGDLVYVDLKQDRPPICAISRYIGDRRYSSHGFSIELYIIETQHHGIVFIDSESSALLKFKD